MSVACEVILDVLYFSLRKATLDGGPELALGAHHRVALVTCQSSCLL